MQDKQFLRTSARQFWQGGISVFQILSQTVRGLADASTYCPQVGAVFHPAKLRA
jgi:hypothetical protein